MPVIHFWNIETVADFEDIHTGEKSCELIDDDIADNLSEYMVECVIDAVNMQFEPNSDYEYSRLCLVREHWSRGNLKSEARAYVIDAELPPVYIDDDNDNQYDIPPARVRELRDFIQNNTEDFDNE